MLCLLDEPRSQPQYWLQALLVRLVPIIFSITMIPDSFRLRKSILVVENAWYMLFLHGESRHACLFCLNWFIMHVFKHTMRMGNRSTHRVFFAGSFSMSLDDRQAAAVQASIQLIGRIR